MSDRDERTYMISEWQSWIDAFGKNIEVKYEPVAMQGRIDKLEIKVMQLQADVQRLMYNEQAKK